MAVTGIGLDLRLTDERCATAGSGAGSWLAVLQGGSSGACGSRLARITLTQDAKNECIKRGVPLPGEITICVSPKCGSAINGFSKMQSVLELLR